MERPQTPFIKRWEIHEQEKLVILDNTLIELPSHGNQSMLETKARNINPLESHWEWKRKSFCTRCMRQESSWRLLGEVVNNNNASSW